MGAEGLKIWRGGSVIKGHLIKQDLLLNLGGEAVRYFA